MKRIITAILSAAVLAATATSGSAQASYPTEPVKLLAPFDAGSATDIIGRIFAEHLQKELGQPVVVENRPGASGIIALQQMMDEGSDGHTLLLGNLQTSVYAPVLMPEKFPKPFNDVATIVARLSDTPVYLLVGPAMPATTFDEMVEHAKAHPGEVRLALAGGIGSFTHLHGARVGRALGVEFSNIPVTGGTGGLSTMMLNGDIQVGFVNAATTKNMLENEGIKALAVMTEERNPDYPEVPTMKELGYPDGTVVFSTSLFAPKDMPAEALTVLKEAVNAALSSADFKEAFGTAHINPAPAMSIEESQAEYAEQQKLWGDLIKDLDIQIQ